MVLISPFCSVSGGLAEHGPGTISVNGAYRARTGNPCLAKAVLSQLS